MLSEFSVLLLISRKAAWASRVPGTDSAVHFEWPFVTLWLPGQSFKNKLLKIEAETSQACPALPRSLLETLKEG